MTLGGGVKSSHSKGLRDFRVRHPEFISGSSHSKTLGSTQKEEVVASTMGQMPKQLCIQAHSSSLRCGGSLCKVRHDKVCRDSKAAFTLAEGATHVAQSAKPRRAAFTLAEVLITLGIIGVVAALTLPTVINNYQKQETVSKIKKVYSILTNTTMMAMSEYGDTVGWEIQSGNSFATAKYFADRYVIPFIKVARVCENNNSDDCAYPIYGLNGQRFSHDKNYDNNSYCFYLADGTYIALKAYTTSVDHPKQVYIVFDINGQRGPNKVGRDVFCLQYLSQTKRAASKEYEGKILPAWIDAGGSNPRATILSAGNDYFCNKAKKGIACLAVIFMDGWQIKDDYPW